jgi:hypothetical protein
MSGVYTNLAKKRAEQSNEAMDLGSVPPLSETPIAEGAQDKTAQPRTLSAQDRAENKETRKQGNKETGKQGSQETTREGNVETTATEVLEFDLNIEPNKKGTFLFTYEELDAIDDLKKQMKRRMDLPATQYDIVRGAIHIIVADYRQRGTESLIVQRMRQKKARS